MFSLRTSTLSRIALRKYKHFTPLVRTMPITELAIPKLKSGPEVKVALEKVLPSSLPILASQRGLVEAFFGSVIKENEVNTEEENKPIIVIEWTEEAAFNAFIASEDFQTFIAPTKPFSAGPPELQLFDTDVGPLRVASSPFMEIIRIQLGDDPKSAAVTADAWSTFVNAMLGIAPVTSGVSVNLKEKVYMGTIGWKSLEARHDTFESLPVRTAMSILRAGKDVSSVVIKVQSIKSA